MAKDIRFVRGRSRWPTNLDGWENIRRPRSFSLDTLRNLSEFLTIKIPSQVDPWYMGPILAQNYLENNRKPMYRKDILRFAKQSLDEMSFMCGEIVSDHKQQYFSGSISYQSGKPTFYLPHFVSHLIGNIDDLSKTVVNSMRMAGIEVINPGEFYNTLQPSAREIFESSGMKILMEQ
jgi:hypothetical protein